MSKGNELIARILKLASIAEQTSINESSESWVAYFNEVSPANVRELIAALEQAQQYAKQRDDDNQDLMLTVGRLRVEREQLEASKLSVKLPSEYIEMYGTKFYMHAHVVEAIRAAGGTVEGSD